MPIRVVAFAEIAVAIVVAIWLALLSGEKTTPHAHAAFYLAALNAIGILCVARRASSAGLWLVAFGALLLLTVAAAGLWAPWLFPPADSFAELMAPALRTLEAVTMLAGAAFVALATGWGIVLFRLLYLRRRMA